MIELSSYNKHRCFFTSETSGEIMQIGNRRILQSDFFFFFYTLFRVDSAAIESTFVNKLYVLYALNMTLVW